MHITWDEKCNMGYIHLVPRGRQIRREKDHNLVSYLGFDEKEIDIPLIEGYDLNDILDDMRLMKTTYKDAIRIYLDFDEEFQNDVDDKGYLEGIELSIDKEKLIKIFEEKAFKIYKTIWKEKKYYLLTLDVHESVFDYNNVIYPLTDKEDAFVIVNVMLFMNQFKIGFIKGIITTENDIYSIEYLMNPQFIAFGY